MTELQRSAACLRSSSPHLLDRSQHLCLVLSIGLKHILPQGVMDGQYLGKLLLNLHEAISAVSPNSACMIIHMSHNCKGDRQQVNCIAHSLGVQ